MFETVPGLFVEEMDACDAAVRVFAQFRDEPFSFFLDSGMEAGRLGRYSFISSRPFAVVKARGNVVTVDDGKSRIVLNGDSVHLLCALVDEYRTEEGILPVPFGGGAVGYLSYDLGRAIERVPVVAKDDLGLPDYCFGLYDSVVAFDHTSGKVYAIASGLPEREETRRREKARRTLEELKAKVAAPRSRPEAGWPACARLGGIQSNFTKDQYLAAVERARKYIIDGDIFEVNLSQRFEASFEGDAYGLYEVLRRINPAPFAAYLGFDDVRVVSSSPERFLRKTGDGVETRPIKGTRRRGHDAVEDKRLANELLSSAKDRAENIMIVDLERNDLGRVCRYGSVRVSELAILETYSTVFHLTSAVEGRLRPDKTNADLLRAMFPGGSITGAPKVRAMQIIEELEPTRRSVYTGSIGYMGFDGNIDLNIAIRTFLIKGGRAYFQAGGAVVYDSDPESEYEETMHKAKALFEALGYVRDSDG